MVKVKLPLTGRCQCGAVAYRVLDAPLMLYCCHCTECQHQSSSAFGMSSLVRYQDLQVDWDDLLVWTRPTDSGNQLDCFFCKTCGGRLFHASKSEKEIVSIKAGSFDDHSWLYPVGHIWTNSAQPWFAIPGGTLVDPVDPTDMAPYFDRWAQATKGWFEP